MNSRNLYRFNLTILSYRTSTFLENQRIEFEPDEQDYMQLLKYYSYCPQKEFYLNLFFFQNNNHNFINCNIKRYNGTYCEMNGSVIYVVGIKKK